MLQLESSQCMKLIHQNLEKVCNCGYFLSSLSQKMSGMSLRSLRICFLESQEIESRELKIPVSECQKISNKINDLTDPIVNGMLEEEQERISVVNHKQGIILDEGPTYKVVLRGNAMIPLVFDEIGFGSELHELIGLIDLASRNFPTP